MTNHGYVPDNVGAVRDNNVYPMMFAGPVGHHATSMPTIHAPFLPVTTHPMMPPYQINYNGYGKEPPSWRANNSHVRSNDVWYRQNVSDMRMRRGRTARSYSNTNNTRAALFIEHATGEYNFVERDLVELFVNFGGISKIDIKPTFPAAELTFIDNAGGLAAIDELNGIAIPGVGTLRCVELRNGEKLDHAISNVHLFDQNRNSGSYNTGNSYNDTRHKRAVPTQNTVYARVARLELIDLFTYEPGFGITEAILGPNNSNIEYIMRNSGGVVDIAIRGKPLNSAPVAERLHVCLSSREIPAYLKALDLLEDLLTSVCERFVEYAQTRGKPVSNHLGFKRHEYQEINGKLEYYGVTERPKSWLQKRRHNPQQNVAPYYQRVPFKRPNDRNKGVPTARSRREVRS
ncbi:uncharacterized protein BXIN_2264 [Babesia sp. Xinjiang]|uniref:uncharacterized protein n=1 Tax=Babesia sp. Xinjiang TaxID=462227 RepID=UPI000A2335B7|nr:uncharacterized protein BXIN_2264 [Babesia sp. Xinjiang]ORM40805.1 hypothetical protein BXIN_2264 [Babesia sp. Xinjiang]